MSRIERLAALLDEPLLVTSGVNVRYLTGLSSSNAALLVASDGDATLFTDFRYAQKAKAIEGVRFEQTARAVIADLATRLAGRTIGIEAHVLTVASHETLKEGGVETVQVQGLVERLRAVKEPAEIETIREAAAISDLMFAALAEERFTGRTEREVAWRVRELFHEHGSSELAFDTIVAAAENGASPTQMCETSRFPPTRWSPSTPVVAWTAMPPTARAPSRRAISPTSSRAPTRCVSKRSWPGSMRSRREPAVVTWTQPRAT